MMNQNLTGVILAGGQARRMQSDPALLRTNPFASRLERLDASAHERPVIEKGLLDWHGKPLVAHAAAYLEQRTARVLISANHGIDRYAGYAQVVPDDDTLGQDAGPLAGVASALALTLTPWLLVVPVDVPCLPPDLAERLLHAALDQDSALAYACTQRPHPLCMVVHRHLLPDLRSYLLAGERKVLGWHARHKPARVMFPQDKGWFLNLNTPDDWRQARDGS